MTDSDYDIPRDEIRRATEDTLRKSGLLMRVINEVMGVFGRAGELMFLDIMPQGDVEFRAFVFFATDDDFYRGRASGLNDRICKNLIESLEKHGFGRADKMSIDFEFDSIEEVDRSFGGSMQDRIYQSYPRTW